jgi:hypothetical protein
MAAIDGHSASGSTSSAADGNPNCAVVVGKQRAARVNLHIHPRSTRRCWVGLPLASRLAQQVLQQVRPWIEPAQSFEKNQLGLGDVFVNNLRFTWTMALLADAAVLLRARALLGRPSRRPLLVDLMPSQLSLELGAETPVPFLPKPNANSQNPQ